MQIKRSFACLALVLSLASACITADDTYTFYLEADGAVQVIVMRDRVASDSKKPQERNEEEAKWLKEFKAGKSDLHKRLKESKAKSFEARLLRSQRPFAALYQGRYAKAEGLAGFFEWNKPEPDGKVELIQDPEDPAKKKLLFTLFKKKPAEAPSPSPSASPVAAASPSPPMSADTHVGAVKFVPSHGHITATHSCKIIDDGRACLLDMLAIDKESKSNEGDAHFWVEWTTAN